MKTKEFIKKVEGLGYKTQVYLKRLRIREQGCMVALVCLNKRFIFETNFVSGSLMDEKLFDLLVEYARTPIEDREEEKKFYLRHKYIRFIDGSAEYYTTCTSQKFPLLEYKAFSDGFNQQFTLKEIEEIKEKFDTDLADFELVEVKDD